jgi:hypothetical protein
MTSEYLHVLTYCLQNASLVLCKTQAGYVFKL